MPTNDNTIRTGPVPLPYGQHFGPLDHQEPSTHDSRSTRTGGRGWDCPLDYCDGWVTLSTSGIERCSTHSWRQ